MTTSVPSSESNTASSSSMEDGSSDNHIDNHIGQQQQRQPQTTNTGSFHSLQRPLHSSLLTSLPQSPSASAAANLFYQQPQYSQSTSALSPMFVLHDPATRLPLARKEDDKDFHHTFLKIPNTDHLIKSYSAAYQSDVLVQGRFWVSQHHVAWRGWKDEPIVIHFNRITAIEKKNIALLIPNSLEIEVEGKTRHFFATFFNRDETFQVMNLLWNAHVKPSLSFQKYLERVYSECTCEGEGLCEACQIADSYSSPSSNSLDSSGHSSTSLHRSSTTTAALRHRCSFNNLRSESEYGGTVVNKSETLDHFETTSSHSIHDSNNDGKADCDNDEGFEATTTDTPQTVLATTVAGETSQDEDAPEANGEEASSEQEPLLVNAIPAATIPLSTGSDDASAAQHAVINKKNRSHSKTRMKRQIKHHEIRECACASETGEMTTLLDKIYDVSLERIFHICYSPKPAEARKPVVLGPFLEEVRKHRDIKFSNWVNEENLCQVMKSSDSALHPTTFFNVDIGDVRKLEYIMAINNPLGPRQTRCEKMDSIVSKKNDSFICVETETKTPDVPSGGSFFTKTRTCLMYVGPNRTRVNVVYSVEFIKSTWIRAAIEKGANDGIREDYRVLDKYLMGFLEKNPEGNSAEENYSGMENLQLQQNPQQLPQQYQRRTSMLQSMKSRRRGAAVNIETSHFAHHSSSKTRSNNKPPSSSTSSASSTISSARSAPPTATSKSDYKTNLVAVFLDPIFSSIKIRFKTLTTPTASVPKWVSFIAWINVIILLVVNLLILWRVSMVMERFDERFRLLLLDDRHSLAAILPHTAPNSLLSDILGDIKQHGVKMREELLRLKTTIEEVKAIQESGK